MENKITLEDIKNLFDKIWGNLPKESKDFGYIGNGIYKLPGGGLTGEGGWKLFQEALKKEGEKYGK